MTPKEETTVAAVTAKLTGTYTYDNEATQMREFWAAGCLTHSRPRAGCDGTFFDLWGTYSTPRQYRNDP